MITSHRLWLGVISIARIGEVFRCFFLSSSPLREVLAYLQLRALHYPYLVNLKNGLRVQLYSWEDLTTAWVVLYGEEYVLKSTDRVGVDLGANIGAFAVYAAKRLPEAAILALEPFPSTSELLEQSVEINGLVGRFRLLHAAAAGSDWTVYMDASEDIPSHSRCIQNGGGWAASGISLQSLLEKERIDEIDFLKVDIEGAEYDFIERTPPEVLRKVRRIGL